MTGRVCITCWRSCVPASGLRTVTLPSDRQRSAGDWPACHRLYGVPDAYRVLTAQGAADFAWSDAIDLRDPRDVLGAKAS